ncbi:MAG: anti-sigma factor [Steroidobacteraceae bacterium]
MLCAETLRVQAYCDGEIDAVSAAEIERHLERCPECRDLRLHLQQIRTALRRDLSRYPVSAQLARRIQRSLEREARNAPPAQHSARWPRAAWALGAGNRRSFWRGALSGAGVSALAVVLALFLWLPFRPDALTEDLMSAHLRSLMSEHLIDVQSSDHHTVKPWFAGHTDVSPAVADFSAQGYALVGGRADYLVHQRAAVLVYRHGAHVIDVFAWAAARPAGSPAHWRQRSGRESRDGYQLLFWQQGDIEYCAVSDTGQDELQALAALIQAIK